MATTSAAKKEPSQKKYTFEYYSTRPTYWAYDGIPFGGVYGATLVAIAAIVAQRGSFVYEHLLWLLVPVVLHVGVFLATQWSVEAKCMVRYRRETSLERASHAKVSCLKKGQQGQSTLLVPIEQQDGGVYLIYQKRKFVFNRETNLFERLKFDITAPLGTYLASSGLSANNVVESLKKFGANSFDIPIPTFNELFKEHAVAPFFVFQLVCVLLWLMDEYWYYSLLTLFMLVVLEAQMVARRRGDLAELRAMRIPPRRMDVYRDGSWKGLQSDQLLPGDIVAVTRKADVSLPCDVLLLQGNVLANEAALTGESVPQMKVACTPSPGSPELDVALDMKGVHKQHIVSAGTTVLMHQNTSKAKTNFKKLAPVGSSPPAVGYVLRTGFDTTQGKLCRTILFSAERVTVQSREALHFLMILLVFAIGACCYVLYDGLVVQPTRTEEAPRSSFKLFLAVSHIITAVVPPEFPIMLSLAVNLCLVALVQKHIFCTEPFRVPVAGRVETCCFDKTGTLTTDAMEVDGVHGLPGDGDIVEASKKNASEAEERKGIQQVLPFLTTMVMGCCSGLTKVEDEVVGDPLEKAALQAISWVMLGPDTIVSKMPAGKNGERVLVLRRFPFASELQRMAVLVKHQGPGLGHLQSKDGATAKADDPVRYLALVKGSCEALRPRLRDVPSDFDSIQESLTKSGLRTLCLAAKEMPSSVAKREPEQIDREELEGDLEFCGLLALRNAIKPLTTTTVKQLRRSYHRVVMITGDHPLTACQVATNISMADRPFMTLELGASSSSDTVEQSLEWRSSTDGAKAEPFNLDAVKNLTRKHTLCVPGWALSRLAEEQLTHLAPLVTVWARVSPSQKEQVIVALNRQSHTMMVGDGTNDVGALKHAHVGVSLLTTAVVAPSRVPGQPMTREELMASQDVPIVRLGDASIASPFTYKGDDVKCSLQILRCGRATLATVLMMYKIMGLNSVMSAFAMSVLTLDGVKLGDTQTAVESLWSSACFFLVSRAAPAKHLAKQMPIGSVFSWPVLVTLAIQLVVHLTILYNGWVMAKSYRPADYKRDLEGDFAPNLTNSVVFQLMAAMHASSFLANYEGHPFMQPLRSNRALLIALGVFLLVIFATAAEVLPELNSSLSLVESPNEDFRNKLLLMLTVDVGASVLLPMAVNSLAIHLRGRAAERRARQLGLGMLEDEGSSKKSSKSGGSSKSGSSKSSKSKSR